MPRLPKKKTKVLAEKKAFGETLGKLKAEEHFAKTKKGQIRAVKTILRDMLKNVNPVDSIAIIGTTVLVKMTIDKSEELRGKLKGLRLEHFPMIFSLTEPIWEQLKQKEKNYEGYFPDWTDWLISFAIAYVIVKHGGALFTALGSGMQGLTSIITLFFA